MDGARDVNKERHPDSFGCRDWTGGPHHSRRLVLRAPDRLDRHDVELSLYILDRDLYERQRDFNPALLPDYWARHHIRDDCPSDVFHVPCQLAICPERESDELGFFCPEQLFELNPEQQPIELLL